MADRRVGKVRAATVVLMAAVVVASVGAVLPSTPAGAATQSAQITISPPTQTQLTGSPQTYNINVACLGTEGAACGPTSTITIPLDTGTTPPMTDPSWTYTATTGAAGLLLGPPTVVGDTLVLLLNDQEFVGGTSGSIRLQVTPPNAVTPNNTTWSMAPVLTGGNIDPTPAPTPAQSTATATPLPLVTKVTADGGSVYSAGATVTYNITANCSTATTGNLYLASGSLVDHLPPGVIYQSSTNGGVYDPVANTVTWTYPDGTSTPAGCAAGSTGANAYQVVVQAPDPAPAVEPLTNQATFTGTGPDAQDPDGITRSTTAQVPIQIVDMPATGPGGPGYATIAKTSLAPLVQNGVSGNAYIGTYPGNWLPASSTPGYTVGAAAGSFRATVHYAQVDTYQTDLIDPLPCLDDVSGNVYSSAAYTATPCADPAFHTTVIQVASAGYAAPTNGLGAAYNDGWRPTAILTDGQPVSLTAVGSVGTSTSSAYFSIPSGDDVATIELPPDAALMNATLQLTLWGYADASLALVNSSINQLVNTATALPELVPGTPLSPVQASANIFTVPTQAQLGIAKSFGPTGGGPGGTTVVHLVGGLNLPATPLVNAVVLADLLPSGMQWADPVATTPIALAQGGVSKGTVSASVQDLPNYQGSGRELIRVVIPAADITTAGSWTMTPSTNFLEVTTPAALGVYLNTDQIFLFGLGTSQITDSCTTPTQTGGGVSPATFESSNPQDLAGDGNLSEDYCQNSASLLISGTGAAFSLTKTVQGDLDSVPRGGLGIGNASPGGSGTYVLNWANVGSDTLNNAVIYDILPFVGDTGVSQGQAGNPRGSQFAPVLASLGTLPPGVTVEYSMSTNPCRDEVYPDTANPSCVNDWTSVAPPSLGSVLALRFASSSSYRAGTGFAVSVTVDVPAGVVNQVAWNSAATNADDVSDPTDHPLATEPAKVGLVAPSTPTLATATSAPSVPAFGELSDQVTITGTGGAPGTLAWSLVGPVPPVGGSCAGVDWTGPLPVAESGTVPISGDGTVTTGPAPVAGVGCYSWSDTLTGTSYAYSGASAAGLPGEITDAVGFVPAIATVAGSTKDGPTQSATDTLTVSGVPAAAPANTVTWTLYGPIAPVDSSCSGLDWTGATALATDTLTVTGSGTFDTPAVPLADAGCYSYGEELPATDNSSAVSLAPGDPTETLYGAPPTLTSLSSATALQPNQMVSDTVTIAGTGGGSGTLAWSLIGPVAPVDDACTAVSWDGAPVVDSGTVATTDDESVTTGPSQVGLQGCYTWVDTLTAADPEGFPSPATLPAGAADEVIQVTPFAPTLATVATTGENSDGAHTVTDKVTVTGTGLAANPTLPPASLSWKLLGPVAPSGTSCAGLTWTGAAVVAAGTIAVAADGSYQTPNTTISAPGCYSFTETLAATDIDDPATSAAGLTAETVQLPAAAVPPPPAGGGSGGTGQAAATGGPGPTTSTSGSVLAMTGADFLDILLCGLALLALGSALRTRRRRSFDRG